MAESERPSAGLPVVVSEDERERILARRLGFIVGATVSGSARSQAELRRMARREFPLPMITRPRVVRHGKIELQLSNGFLQHREKGERWRTGDLARCLRGLAGDAGTRDVAGLLEILLDLFRRPTEQVPDEGEEEE